MGKSSDSDSKAEVQAVVKAAFRGRFLRDPKLEKFARLYFVTGDKAAAYREAGFKGKNARDNSAKLLRRPEVDRRIAQMQREAEARSIEDATTIRNEVLEMLRENAAKAQVRNDLSARNRAAELIGKTVGMFTETIRHEDPWANKSREEMILAVDAFLQDPVVRSLVRERIAAIDGRDFSGAADEKTSGVSSVSEAEGVSRPKPH